MVLPNKTLKGKMGGDKEASSSGAMHITVGVDVDDGGRLRAYVKNVAQSEAAGTVQAYDQALPDRVQQINENPRWR